MKNWFFAIALGLTVECAFAQTAPPPSWGCIASEYSARLLQQDPAYADAIHLSQVLLERGVAVKCILTSKMAQFFPQQKGAALYRTDHGDFEALFALKPQDFAQLSTTATRRKDGYDYEFHLAGIVRHFVSSGEMYFAKHDNAFLIMSDTRILQSLDGIFSLLATEA